LSNQLDIGPPILRRIGYSHSIVAGGLELMS